MRHQRLVAPIVRGARRYASTDTARQPGWRKMMNRMLGKEAEEDQKASAVREELETKRAQDEQLRTLKLDDATYEVAALPKRFTDLYVQADTVKDLPLVIGSDEWVKQLQDEGVSYRGYAPSEQWTLTAPQWADVLQHTLVELLVLMKNGRSPKELCNIRNRHDTWRYTRAAEVTVDGGKIKMQFSEPEHEQQILSSITTESQPTLSTSVIPQKEEAGLSGGTLAKIAAQEIARGFTALEKHRKRTKQSVLANKSIPKTVYEWLKLPIRDPQMKLAILQRITQLTSRRITNTVSGDAATLQPLIKLLAEPVRKPKLVTTKQVATLKTSLPNVTVYDKRRTLINREQDIGRWKLITRELQRRQLPVRRSELSSKQKINVI